VNTLGGPWNVVLDGGADLPTEGEEGSDPKMHPKE